MDICPASMTMAPTASSLLPLPLAACPYLSILRKAIPNDCRADQRSALLDEKYAALMHLLDTRLATEGRIDLRRTDLSGMDLKNCNLLQIDFRFAKLNQVCFDDAHIDSADFSHADLSGSSFVSANLDGVSFEKAECYNVDFSDATVGGAWFDGANLAAAKVPYGIYLDAVEVSNIKLLAESDYLPPEDKAIRLMIPDVWNRDTLDAYLDHIHNDVTGSLLSTINSIDMRYDDKKVELVCALAASLMLAAVDLSTVAVPILSALYTTPYLANGMLSAWLHDVTRQLLKKYNSQRMPRPEGHLSDAMLECFRQAPTMMCDCNAAFIQFVWWELSMLRKEPELVKLRRELPGGIGFLDGTATSAKSSKVLSGIEKAEIVLANRLIERYLKTRWLYDYYLNHPAVSPYTRLSDFGNYAYQADFDSADAANYLLFSCRKNGPVMLLSGAALAQWLDTSVPPTTIRSHFFLYQGMQNLSLGNIDIEALFEQHFPLFFGICASMKNIRVFEQLLNEFAFNMQMANWFGQALRQRSIPVTLTAPADVEKLRLALMPAMHGMAPPYLLNEQHYQRIVDIYSLQQATPERQAVTLMILAAMFTCYASSRFFGAEQESPLPLRLYAYALMIKSEQRAPTLFAEVLPDWKDRQLGNRQAYTCAALLSEIMIGYLQQKFPTELIRILPLAWH